MAIRILLGLVLLFLIEGEDGFAMGRRRDRALMAVMGDSISAGTLADIPLRPCSGKYREDCRAVLRQPDDGQLNAEAIWENKVHLSWASGDGIPSHYRQLSDYMKRTGDPRKLKVKNFAKPGARVGDLSRQASMIRAEMETGHYTELAYVTLEIGANDVCASEVPSLDEMRADLLRAFLILSFIQQDSKIRVLFVGIPKIPVLGSPKIQQLRSWYFGARCRSIQKWFGSCPRMLQWKTAQEYQNGLALIMERNALFRRVAEDAARYFPNLEVVFTEKLYDLPISAPMIAIDCFHPSGRGQQAIAEALWQEQPWFN